MQTPTMTRSEINRASNYTLNKRLLELATLNLHVRPLTKVERRERDRITHKLEARERNEA